MMDLGQHLSLNSQLKLPSSMFRQEVPDCRSSCAHFNVLQVKNLVNILQDAFLDIRTGELVFCQFFDFLIFIILLI